MRKSVKTFITLMLALSTALVGCSSTPEGSSSPTAEKPAESAAPSTAPDRPFVYLEQQVINSIDPAKHTDESSLHAVINTYDPLVYPKIEEGSMEPGPHIAESWQVSEDGKTYTFKLREGVKFHSGNELKAEDVVFSMQRMLSLKKGFSWLWNGILEKENVKATGDYTVEFTLDKPYAPFISTLTQLFIIDSKTVMANLAEGEFGEFKDYGQKYLETNNAGSGPYLIDKWERGSEMVLKKFPDYWKGWKEGQIEQIQYKIVLEEATLKTMIKSGEADMVNQWMSIESFEQLKKEPGIVVEEDPSVQLYHLPINTQKPPFDDINFRKAVLHAFDYKVATEQILNGAEQAAGPVPSLVPGHNPDVTVYQKDMDKAKEFLAKSKYAGQEVEIDYMYISDNATERKTGLLLQSSLKPLNIKVNLVGVPWAQITEATVQPETTPHIVAIYDTLKYPHVDSHTYGIYHPSSKGSYRSSSWYDNPQTAEVLDKARSSTDPQEQEKYYKEAQKLITDDAVSLYIANPMHYIAYRDYVQGYKFLGILGYDVGFYYFTLKK
ncbi:ABC transporter substrate-binding protein [Brevibacillus humidisoli]|uniref:ABC transporter substrate-binding protein n=1 Tax=Brevibacillus humidisoli TaxID=2895522 RepID=UPI001E2898C6|nr:ABC transporter substrate-binding protein [Brevibacillus humidisoli]UFJ39267.1 ABC transporter substrate-binding protein [Brevibacillus humidisoli]